MTMLAPAPSRAAVFHPLTVAAVDRLCEDAVAITFAVPDELRDAYAFRAGQSLTLRRVIDGREHRRSYSICAPAGAAPRIGVREIPGGLFSSWLVHEVRPGTRIEVQPPTGSWQADPALGERHLCVAAGSGITPMLSVASTVLTHPGAQVSLLYGNRTSRTVMFAEELGDLKNRYGPRLQVVHALSREPRDVELLSGRLDGDRLRRLLTGLVPVEVFDHVWLCGPLQLVEQARAVLAELGVPADRVHVELFYADAPPPPPRRAAGELSGATTELTTVLDGLRTTATVSRETTLLDGAQNNRGDLPFACKGGVCGTCRAVVREGEVDMRRNYALEPAEVAAGFVLTCQTYPVGEQVTVDYDA
ncbi:1,2-phenylacetyl-CoA epoxidase subunit PaaE [Nonomuraea gerenzanensis]|uniref:Phenylacetate-CoA oxygenase/reductase, PaaK subunit n=2 Tax=Nonomuraea gerenzanensis TaxID=93944 RepID=A0A1M4EFP2_9ACTN|nr:1,2-phenylacetyl-CoA epoxidase subunit PaaE [Nonomuraea gerenzanensis]UBU09303.1 phenylacetate-CoA oxygenase/reductase subunit PaaK [Nonomuraea gerenzanensis]SBO97709.1 Phenylacetate-CoA oxygenase/reductase, PaaK subunit [Nonomuraea gerenzanensis]